MSRTKIEWSEMSWNPVVGCSHISEGCRNCYAEKMAYRLACMGQKKYQHVISTDGGKWNGKTYCDEKALEIPLHWRKFRMIFVCSMSDLFGPSVPFEFIDKVMAVIALCPQHTFQILTKRPKRMLKYIDRRCVRGSISVELGSRGKYNSDHCFGKDHNLIWPFPNLWLGVTAENQEQADKRIPILLQIPAAVRFVSIEPMLGAISLDMWINESQALLDQVIVGGESGPGARPMHPDWARGVRDQCVAAGVPFFFKQWGEYAPCEHFKGLKKPGPVISLNGQPSGMMTRIGKKKAGRLLDGKEWSQYPKKGGE